METETNTCDFCRAVTTVSRQYLHAKNDRGIGDGFAIVRYCHECGLLEDIELKDVDNIWDKKIEREREHNKEMLMFVSLFLFVGVAVAWMVVSVVYFLISG